MRSILRTPFKWRPCIGHRYPQLLYNLLSVSPLSVFVAYKQCNICATITNLFAKSPYVSMISDNYRYFPRRDESVHKKYYNAFQRNASRTTRKFLLGFRLHIKQQTVKIESSESLALRWSKYNKSITQKSILLRNFYI